MKYTSEEKSNHKPTWQEILREGEMSPPDSLWEAIEAQLPKKPSRKILPIWWTSPMLRIASGVLLSLGIASALYVWQERDRRAFASNHQKTTKQTKAEKQLLVLPKLAQIEKDKSSSPRTFVQNSRMISKTRLASGDAGKKGNQVTSLPFSPALEVEKEVVLMAMHSTETRLINGLSWVDYGSRFAQNRRRFLAVPSFEIEDKKEDEPAIAQKTWIQVGGGISPFNPQLELADFPTVASRAVLNTLAQNKVSISTNEGGITVAGTPNGPTDKNGYESLLNRPAQTFRMGVASQWAGTIGKVIAPRWQLETGIRWMNGRASTAGNVFAFDEATGDIQPFFEASYLAETNANRNALSTVLAATEQTNVSFQYIAIPLQVGYMVPLAAQWQAILYTGVSTDFFRNYGRQLEGESAEKVYQSSNSRFRPVTWSGLAGVRIARTFQENWQISVGAQMQESLSSGLDNEANANFRPRMFGVQYGLGYVF
ncbi:MAG: hypothetical protein ACK4UP_09860 [Spirosomataceae bacterium]